MANRNHRKILVADGSVGMIGGVGIAQEWTGDAQDPDHWRDTHLRVRGPVVRGLQGAFAESWLEATGRVLVGDAHLPELERTAEGGLMQLVRSRAGVGDTNVEALYFLAIASAQRTLDLTAAYFAPRRAFIDALVEARERGATIRVLVPGPHIDKPFVRAAGRAAYEELLETASRSTSTSRPLLHAKTLVVDGAWSSVGSVNFDNRSFQLHEEATLCVQSEELAAARQGRLDGLRQREAGERGDRGRRVERDVHGPPRGPTVLRRRGARRGRSGRRRDRRERVRGRRGRQHLRLRGARDDG
jgi:cardiolipin synthase